MPVESGGIPPLPGEAESWQQHGNHHRNSCGNRSPHLNKKFEGKCEALKGHVYDISTVEDGYNLFNRTTKAIGEYVVMEYKYAGKYRRGLTDMELPELEAPALLNPTNVIEMADYARTRSPINGHEGEGIHLLGHEDRLFSAGTGYLHNDGLH